VAQQPKTYTYADDSLSRSSPFLTAFVAKNPGHCHLTIRDRYDAPIAANIAISTILPDAADGDAMAMAATIANWLEMDRISPWKRLFRDRLFWIKPKLRTSKALDKRAGFNLVDSHLEADCKRIGYIGKDGRAVGSCRRLEMLVGRLKCYSKCSVPRGTVGKQVFEAVVGL
jgi:hypothetical protein